MSQKPSFSMVWRTTNLIRERGHSFKGWIIGTLRRRKHTTSGQINMSDKPQYHVITKIGKGGNGLVHLAININSRMRCELVAIKTIYRTDEEPLPHEVSILQLLGQHKNIVRCHAVINEPSDSFYQRIAFEYCAMGDLANYMDTFDTAIPDSFMWNVLQQVSNALHMIHQEGVVHGDLKLLNVLVTPSQPGEIWPILKIADFGTAQYRPSRNIPRAHIGTWCYNPPESTKVFGPETDIWALGVMIHYLATHKEPFTSKISHAPNAREWFRCNYGYVPLQTPEVTHYVDFCFWLAHSPVSITRIDRLHRLPAYGIEMRSSKLLNYFMMRCLDREWQTRISASELHRFVPTIEVFARELEAPGIEELLDRFDDGRDEGWNQTRFMTDSMVVEQMYYAVEKRFHRLGNPGIMRIARNLPSLMDNNDFE